MKSSAHFSIPKRRGLGKYSKLMRLEAIHPKSAIRVMPRREAVLARPGAQNKKYVRPVGNKMTSASREVPKTSAESSTSVF